jgi:hypothetical protein
VNADDGYSSRSASRNRECLVLSPAGSEQLHHCGQRQNRPSFRHERQRLCRGLLAPCLSFLLGGCGVTQAPDMFDEAQTVLEAFHVVDSGMVAEFGSAAGPGDVRAPIPGQATLQMPFAPTRYRFRSQYSVVLDGVDPAVALEAVRAQLEVTGFRTTGQFMSSPSGRTAIGVHVYPPGPTGQILVYVSATSERMGLPRGYADIVAVRQDWESRLGDLAGPILRE